MIKPVPGGAKGKAIPFEGVYFTYRLAPHLQFNKSGEISMYIRDSKRRMEKNIFELSGTGSKTLRLHIGPAYKGRKPYLELLYKNKVVKKAELKTSFDSNWKKLTLTLNKGTASIAISGKKPGGNIYQRFQTCGIQMSGLVG